MPRVVYEDVAYELREGESALDALLRSGLNLPHSCKTGVCGSCLMRAVPPCLPSSASQAGLKDSWKANGYFLPCVCYPETDLVAGTVDVDVRVAVTIASIERLSDSVLRVLLSTDAPFEYRPGQFITLLRHDGLARSYSVASLPEDDQLELHVRLIPNGRMSQWLAQGADREGASEELYIQGPSGECFYIPGREEQPILLLGTGTGLAPLYGVVRDSLRQGHIGPIHLFHGAAAAAGLYFGEKLDQLVAQHSNFTFTQSTLTADGPIDQAVLDQHPTLAGWRVFLCGDPAIVQSCKKKIFLAGAALNDIHADAFLPSAN